MKCTVFRQETAPLTMFIMAEVLDGANRHLQICSYVSLSRQKKDMDRS